MTITPTRLPGVRAALIRLAAALLGALAHGVSGPALVTALSACAACMIASLGTISTLV